LKLESNTVQAQVDNWSKLETQTKVTKIDAAHDKLELSNGKTFTYKALVLTPGFEHSTSFIKGLETLEKTPE
jgi:NADH dehydrogenase FAD-containing subunit